MYILSLLTISLFSADAIRAIRRSRSNSPNVSEPNALTSGSPQSRDRVGVVVNLVNLIDARRAFVAWGVFYIASLAMSVSSSREESGRPSILPGCRKERLRYPLCWLTPSGVPLVRECIIIPFVFD